jgi:hypothetical protein
MRARTLDRAGPAGRFDAPGLVRGGARNGVRVDRRRFGLLLVAGLAWAVAVGCATPPRFGPVDLREPGWRVRQGQAVWRARSGLPELAGELLVATGSAGEGLVQFSKTPFPFVTARCAAAGWAIEFPTQRLRFRGRGQPPARFGWLQLPRALGGRVVPGPWEFQHESDGRWRLANPVTGESIEGFLTP